MKQVWECPKCGRRIETPPAARGVTDAVEPQYVAVWCGCQDGTARAQKPAMTLKKGKVPR